MALAGEGAVAIWHDIAPEGRSEFYAWHGGQHMPERVAIPGFLRGRRYVAIDGTPEFFNLYETASTAVLTGPDYLDRLERPTPWTVQTVKHFRSVARSLCEVAWSGGAGEGGLVATFRYAVEDGNVPAHRARMVDRLRGCSVAAGVAGAHWLVADEAASAIETAERRARAEANVVPRWIVLIEGWGDIEPLVALCREFEREGAFEHASGPPARGIYRLQNSLSVAAAKRSGA